MKVADRSIPRRMVTIGVLGIMLPVWIALTPVWVVVSITLDGLGRLRRLPTLRLCTFTAVYMVHEWIGVLAAGWLWLTGSLGRRPDMRAHRAVQAWWATSLLRWAGRLLGVRLDLADTDGLPQQRFIVLSRHASMVDAVIPVVMIAGHLRRYVHYVIKRELRWDPALDLFGTRLGNHFVARGGNTEDEERAITELALGARPESAMVIFPEGTYATPQSRQRVLNSLRRIGDTTVIAKAEALQVLLPPKPAGTLALLRGRPDADVVVVGHVGLGGVARLRGLRRRLPLSEPVVVRWWIHSRQALPTTDDGLTDWLNDRWRELDHWVVETGAGR